MITEQYWCKAPAAVLNVVHWKDWDVIFNWTSYGGGKVQTTLHNVVLWAFCGQYSDLEHCVALLRHCGSCV